MLEAPDDARDTIAMVSFLVLMLMVAFYGAGVASGVAQEKGGRVMEVLLCRVRTRDLLAGKVLGVGAAIAQLLGRSPPPFFALGYAFWSLCFASFGAIVSRPETSTPQSSR